MQPPSCTVEGINGTCIAHDGVDLPLCFTETAVLYGVCVLMWLMASLEFFFTRNRRPKVPFNPLNVTKMVSFAILEIWAKVEVLR